MHVMLNVARVTGPAGFPAFLDDPAERSARRQLVAGAPGPAAGATDGLRASVPDNRALWTRRKVLR
jgi:hypothetical protein